MATEFEKWLSGRPKVIQELGKQYPPGEYKMADGAPYGITCPETIVSVHAYGEDGLITVIVSPENMLPQAIEHSNALLYPQGRDHSELAGKAISARVDPRYLIPYKP